MSSDHSSHFPHHPDIADCPIRKSHADDIQSARRENWSNPVKDSHKKTSCKLKRWVNQLFDLFPPERIGFATFTFPAGTPLDRALEHFRKLTPRLNESFPEGWIRVVGRSDNRGVHFHVLVVAPQEIASGFRADLVPAFRGSIADEETPGQRVTLEDVTSNANLRALCHKLRQDIATCGFGYRFELLPVYKGRDAVKFYFVENYYEAVRQRTFGKRARLISRSRKLPKLPDSQPTERQILFQSQIDRIIEALGVERTQMKHLYGRHWCYKLKIWLYEIVILHSHEPRSWRLDKLRVYLEFRLGWLPPRSASRFEWFLSSRPVGRALEDLREAAKRDAEERGANCVQASSHPPTWSSPSYNAVAPVSTGSAVHIPRSLGSSSVLHINHP